MKNEIPQPVIIAITVVVILIIVGAGYFFFFGNNPDKSPNSPQAAAQYKAIHENDANLWKQRNASSSAATAAPESPASTPGTDSAYGQQKGSYTPIQGGRGVHTGQRMGN